MATLEPGQILAFLEELGGCYTQPATLTLLGGSALCLLGSERPTLDIDYVGDDLHKNALQNMLEQIADELQVEVEAVPIEHFVPIPLDSQERQIYIGRFGEIDTIDDILFMLQQSLITIEQLADVVASALEQWKEFSLDRAALRDHLKQVQNRLCDG